MMIIPTSTQRRPFSLLSANLPDLSMPAQASRETFCEPMSFWSTIIARSKFDAGCAFVCDAPEKLTIRLGLKSAREKSEMPLSGKESSALRSASSIV